MTSRTIDPRPRQCREGPRPDDGGLERLARAAHELRAPAAGIAALSRTLRREPLPPGAREGLALIEAAARRLIRLGAAVLDLPPGGSHDLAPERFGPESSARSVLALLRACAPRGDRSLILRRGPGVPAEVEGSADAFEQALTALVGNALAHGAGPVRVHLGWSARAGGLQIVVSNALVPPGKRSHPGPDLPAAGSGRGLAILRHLLAEAGGGGLEVGWRRGVHRARFHLPVQVIRGSEEERNRSTAMEGGWVLVVDDDPLSRRHAVDCLAGLGHPARGVASLADAQAVLRRERVDWVLSDLWLGDGSGTDLAAWIAEIPEVAARPRVLIMSSDRLAAHRRWEESHGVLAWLTKPIEPRRLAAHLVSAPGRSTLRPMAAWVPSRAALSGELPGFARTLARLAARCDLGTLAARAHRMRGAASLVGATALAKACAEVEHQAAGGDPAGARAAAAVAIRQALAAIDPRAVVGPQPAPAPPSPNGADAHSSGALSAARVRGRWRPLARSGPDSIRDGYRPR